MYEFKKSVIRRDKRRVVAGRSENFLHIECLLEPEIISHCTKNIFRLPGCMHMYNVFLTLCPCWQIRGEIVHSVSCSQPALSEMTGCQSYFIQFRLCPWAEQEPVQTETQARRLHFVKEKERKKDEMKCKCTFGQCSFFQSLSNDALEMFKQGIFIDLQVMNCAVSLNEMRMETFLWENNNYYYDTQVLSHPVLKCLDDYNTLN